MAAEPAGLPDPPLDDENGEPIPIAFTSQADYEAWLDRHPEQRASQEEFRRQGVDPHEASRRRWAEWRAAGHKGPPPGCISRREYERRRGL